MQRKIADKNRSNDVLHHSGGASTIIPIRGRRISWSQRREEYQFLPLMRFLKKTRHKYFQKLIRRAKYRKGMRITSWYPSRPEHRHITQIHPPLSPPLLPKHRNRHQVYLWRPHHLGLPYSRGEQKHWHHLLHHPRAHKEKWYPAR